MMLSDDEDRFLLIRNDPYEFLKAVRTLDEVDIKNPIKHFPYDLEYLRFYVRAWQKYNRILVPKSRRMKMSWTNIALYLHDCIFNIGRRHAFVSKKEDDAADLVKRAVFIIDNLDHSVVSEKYIPKYIHTFGKLQFPEINSVLEGYPQGADQLRQYTFSGILCDEMAFWEKAEEMYSATIPTLEGGGRFTAISSPAPGFFKRLVLDQLETDEEIPSDLGSHKFPMKGLEIWQNPKNKFFVFQCHYSADPKKTPEYMRHIKDSMPLKKWKQEYELSWESWAGLPVYTTYDHQKHPTLNKIDSHIGLPLLRGWDFGLTPACIIAQLQEETLVIIKEFTELNMGADRFSDKVLKACFDLWPEWGKGAWMDFIDPSGVFRADTDENSCAKILSGKGLRCIPGAIPFEERKQSVEYFLKKYTKQGPCFKVSLPDCPTLVKGFLGGYRYSDTMQDIEPSKIRPIKDEHSHPHDALQMITSRIRMMTGRIKFSVPTPGYSWSHGPDNSPLPLFNER